MIMGAVCALACATNLAFSQPASAGFLGFGVMSASEQENWARHLNKEEFGTEEPEMYSEEAYNALPIVRGIQKRISEVNGIEINANRFTDKYDYKTKIHPVNLVDNYMGAYAVGGGHFYVGMEGLKIRGILSFKDQYDYMALEKTIAHETTHCVEGHILYKGKEHQKEVWAEKGSIKYTEKLPEGGWGVYLVSQNNNNGYPEITKDIYQSIEKQANNKIVIKSAADVLYRGKDKVLYPIVKERRGSDASASAYFGGQVAYCISKNAFSMSNIRIVRNHLKNEINFKGDYLLVCESSNLPNGYRVLTELYGDFSTLQKDLDTVKSKICSGVMPLDDDSYTNMQKYWAKKDNSFWKMWLACAIAFQSITFWSKSSPPR